MCISSGNLWTQETNVHQNGIPVLKMQDDIKLEKFKLFIVNVMHIYL